MLGIQIFLFLLLAYILIIALPLLFDAGRKAWQAYSIAFTHRYYDFFFGHFFFSANKREARSFKNISKNLPKLLVDVLKLPYDLYRWLWLFAKRPSNVDYSAKYTMDLVDLLPFRLETTETFSEMNRKSDIYTRISCNTSGNNSQQKYVLISHDLPFHPTVEQVIYIEDPDYPEISIFIDKYYDTLRKLFKRFDYEFVYPAKLQKDAVPAEVLNYMFPYLQTDRDQRVLSAITNEMISKCLAQGTISGPVLLHYRKISPELLACETPEQIAKANERHQMMYGTPFEPAPKEWRENYYFTIRRIFQTEEIPLTDYFVLYVNNITKGYVGDTYALAHTSKSEIEDDDTADYYFDTSSVDLMKEIEVRVKELRRRGVHDYQLRALIEPEPTLSRLVITREFQIILPDYGNIEIKMTPLPKAVFMLFLRHPEGILFKHLSKYREELLYLYRQVTHSWNDETVLQSIEDVTNPTLNSINEKCSRIREAFLREFDECYARYYFVTGKRGEAKSIMLPKEKVVWEVKL